MISPLSHQIRAGYQGGDNFIGGDCNKLLINVDTLAQMCPVHVPTIVRVLRMLNTVVHDCYGDSLAQFEIE